MASNHIHNLLKTDPEALRKFRQAAWQGPLPPPEAVKQFDEIVTNGAERIFRMAELE